MKMLIAAILFAPAIVAAQSVGDRVAPPLDLCEVVVGYHPGQPTMPYITIPGGKCKNPEVALAIALAAVLESTLAVPGDKDQKPAPSDRKPN